MEWSSFDKNSYECPWMGSRIELNIYHEDHGRNIDLVKEHGKDKSRIGS